MNDTTTQQKEQGAAVAVLASIALPAPAKVREEMSGAFAGMYSHIEEEISGLDTDMSQKANREAARALAYRISQTKKRLEETANGTTENMREVVKAVVAERSAMAEEFDKLRDKARAALTAWEQDQQERQDRATATIASIEDRAADAQNQTSEEIRGFIVELEAEIYCEAVFNAGLVERIEATRADALETLRALAERKEKEEADARELAALRAEKEERDRKEAEARAAEEAKKAEEERKQREAEEKERAEKERQRIEQGAKERAEREAKEAIENERREKEAAEQRAKQAEADAKAAAEKAEADRLAAAERAEQEAKEREERAAQAERLRIAEEERIRKEQEEARARDQEHRRAINNAAADALIDEIDDLTSVQAKAIIVAIATGKIPAVKISY